ncbi:Pentatricopeptide repeat-containing protein [Heracleum sosnowskyi]|uniref:Pentatricopeptide repeat-containing protein n=1 Tax=Heracleum sosnowskyi TaxID=360622 RepID=A0AAD8IRL1_9APIA|nr:Pentatricopeptide repeat-containing protein [Heracleum sosnowskyi]
MASCLCSSFNPVPSTSNLYKFISDNPYLTLLETKCNSMKDLQKIHAQLIKTGLVKDTIAASRVLSFCATSPVGDINYAHQVFDQMPHPNLFSWNTIIRGFSQGSTPQIAISLFIDMLVTSSVEPNRLTYPSLFKAYAQLGLAHEGAQPHARIVKLGLEFDAFIRNSLLYMYVNCGFIGHAWRLFGEDGNFEVVAWNSMIMGLAKCGEIYDSRRLFDEMPVRNTVSWNSMISGYVRNGKWSEALSLFSKMQEEKIRPSEFTLVSLLNACSCLGSLRQGEWIHDYIIRNNIEMNVIVVTAIVDMYCKSGSIDMATEVFEASPVKSLSCWNSMIFGLAVNGCEEKAIELFSRLLSSNLKPDDVSFIGVLTACNHSGMVDKAKYYFSLMRESYEIEPSIKHYGCMVDILARAEFIKEAGELIECMPMSPDAIIWGSFLSACRRCGNMEMAQWAAHHLKEFDVDDASSHILMSNLYAATGQFGKAMQERIFMKNKKIEKQPGCSMIEVNGEVHEFVAGGRLHPQVTEIYALLDNLRFPT